MARIPSFDRQIEVMLAAAREQVQEALVEVVEHELDRVKAESNPSSYDQFIDGVKDRAIEQIQPFGEAVFRFYYGREVIAFALEMLRALSPVLKGDYKRSHEVYVDGALTQDWRNIGVSQRVVITSSLAYSRKVEVGWQEHEHPGYAVYQHVAESLRRRYGNVARVTYQWVDVSTRGRVPAIVIEDHRAL